MNIDDFLLGLDVVGIGLSATYIKAALAAKLEHRRSMTADLSDTSRHAATRSLQNASMTLSPSSLSSLGMTLRR
jgi:hypothetical protein